MEQLDRASPQLANRRRRPAANTGMILLDKLARNPMAFTVADGEGTQSISAERGKNGKVWLTCQCAASLADGWCRHRVDRLCFRYDRVVRPDEASKHAFEEIIAGTPLSNAGRDADRALTAFDECLRVFDERRPAEIVGGRLGQFTDLVSDLAACASELEDALGTLRRLLERA